MTVDWNDVRIAPLLAGTALVAASIVTTLPAQAATIDVCLVGCSYDTVTAAVAAAPVGSVVEVAAGTYTENGILLNKAITVQGQGDSTIIDGGGLATPSRAGVFTIRPAVAATSGTGTITVSNMKVVNPPGSSYMNFSIGMKQASTGITDITLNRLNVEGTGSSAKRGYGVYADGGAPIAGVERAAPALVIKNSTFSKTYYNNIGVDAWYAATRIENNDLTESMGGVSAVVFLNEYAKTQIPKPQVVTGNRTVGRLVYFENISQVPHMPSWADIQVTANAVSGLGPNDDAVRVATNTSMETNGDTLRFGKVAVTGNSFFGSGANSVGVRIMGGINEALVGDNVMTGLATGALVQRRLGLAATSVSVADNTITGAGTAAVMRGIDVSSVTGDTTITGNIVSQSGIGVAVGAAATRQGRTTLRDNSIAGDGATPGTVGVSVLGDSTETLIEANDVFGWGTALAAAPYAAAQPGPITAVSNRLFANTQGLSNSSSTSVVAADNWWGCQAGPTGTSTYCSIATGPFTAGTWFATTVTPVGLSLGSDSRYLVEAGQAVDLQTAFVQTDGTTNTPHTVLPSIFDSLPVTYSVDNGTLTGPAQLNGAYTALGRYVAPAAAGSDEARVALDSESFAVGPRTVTGEPLRIPFTVTAKTADLPISDPSTTPTPTPTPGPVDGTEPITQGVGVPTVSDPTPTPTDKPTPSPTDKPNNNNNPDNNPNNGPGSGSDPDKLPGGNESDPSTLPNTGNDVPVGLPWLAAGLVLLGAAVMRGRRLLVR